MPSQISFVDNTPTNALPFSLAHYNMLAAIRLFCGGFGVVGTIGGSRTGTGTLTAIEAAPAAVNETWTLTCTAAAVDGGTFSVVGSVSGAMADATVGVAYAAALIAFMINDGATDYLVGDTFTIPVTQGAASAAGIAYTVLRYDTSATNHELIMMAPGLTGLEEIYIGLRTYHDVGADYYNLLAGVFTGYVPGNTFDTQPGAALAGVPAHNNRIDYWLTMNGQRIACGMKVGTPVYEHFYLGKFLPYSRPSQYPYPVVCGGMLVGAAAMRFSETTHDFYLRGDSARGRLRTPGGWINAHCYPWSNAFIAGNSGSSTSLQLRDTETEYPLLPVELHDNAANLYGQLDGIYYISGFNNAVENTLTIGADSHVVMQSVNRTGHTDYYALRLDA